MGIGRHLALALATAIAASSIGGALAGCGGSSTTPSATTSNAALAGRLHGTPTSPPFPARPLRLRNYDGREVNLRSFRGKAVLVTFIYTHCPDVCPLIVGHLHAAQAELGSAAKKLQIVAVSVDPKGDTPKTVRAFLKAHQMLGIAAQVPKNNPELVEHSAYVFGIDASRTVDTLYPANFKPAWIVRDVPLLASS